MLYGGVHTIHRDLWSIKEKLESNFCVVFFLTFGNSGDEGIDIVREWFLTRRSLVEVGSILKTVNG